MDILKELFGTCDELQINKSLFGSEVGHVESLNMGLDHGLSSSREIIQHPLPLLPDSRPSNPPPLLRSQSLDDLHTTTASEDKDPLEMCRSDGFRPQSAFPQLSESTAAAHGMDLRNVPQEMPMYLLQEDEGNDEEIMRLLCTRNKPLTPFSVGDNFPNSTLSDGDVMAKSFQGSGVLRNDNQGDVRETSGLIAETNSTNIPDETANQIGGDQEVGPNIPVESPMDRLESFRTSETARVSSDSSSFAHVLPSDSGVPDSGVPDSLPDSQDMGSSPLVDTGEKHLVSNTVSNTVCRTQVPYSDSTGRCHNSSSLAGAQTYGRVAGLRRRRKSRVSQARKTVMVNEGTQTSRVPSWRPSEVRVTVGGSQLASASWTQRGGTLRDNCGWSGGVQGNSLPRSHGEARPSSGQPAQMSVASAVNLPGRSTLPTQLKVSNTAARRSQSASPLTVTQTPTFHQVHQSGAPNLVTPHSELAPQSSSVVTSQAGSSNDSVPQKLDTPTATTVSSQKRSILLSELPPASQAAVCSIPPSTTRTAPVVQLPISAPSTASGFSTVTSTFSVSASNQLQPNPHLISSLVPHSLPQSVSSAPQRTISPPVVPTPTPASTSGGLAVTTSFVAGVQSSPAVTSTVNSPFQSTSAPILSRLNAPRLNITSSARTAASAFEHSIEALKRKVLIEAQKLDEALGSYRTHQTSASVLGQPQPLRVTRTSPELPSRLALQTTASTLCAVCTSSSHTLTTSSAVSTQPADNVQSPGSSETPAAISLSLPRSPVNSTDATPGHDSQLAVTNCSSTKSITSSPPLSNISSLVISSVISCREDPCEQVHTPSPNDVSEDNQTSALLNEEREPPPDQTVDVEMEAAPVCEASTESMGKEDKMYTAPGRTDEGVAVESLEKLVPENGSGSARHAKSQQMDAQESAKTAREGSQESTLIKSAAPVSTSKAQPCVGLPTVTVCFPMVDWKTKQVHGTQLMGLSATPIQLLSTSNGAHPSQVGAGGKSSEEGERKKLKRRHGGGWTKGKKRKIETEPRPPKPPSTGYGVFLAEKRASVQQETGCNSMSHISKMLGGMWTALTKEEKEEYYSKAEADKERYLHELRSYLSRTAQGESSSTNLELLDNFLKQSSENESNDDMLVCHMCKITFTSLYNKRSHYLGKIHSQTLVERLKKLVDCQRVTKVGDGGQGREHKQQAPPPPDHLPACSAHEDAAVARSHDCDLVSEVSDMDHNMRPEDAKSSSLCNKERLQPSAVGNCEESAEPISGISSDLNGEVGPPIQEPHSEHVAMDTVETLGTLQCNSSPVVASERLPADLPLADCSASSAGFHSSEEYCTFDSHDVVSSYLHRCATAYQSCATRLCAEKRLHSAALEEHAGLQQQVSELEHLESSQSKALTWLQSEERGLELQVSKLLAVLENTGNTSSVCKMKSLLLADGDSIRQPGEVTPGCLDEMDCVAEIATGK